MLAKATDIMVNMHKTGQRDSTRGERLDGIDRVAAKFAHLGEAKRQREAEQRARADVADLRDE